MRLCMAILAAGALALPALASSTTIEFAGEDGSKTVVELRADGTASLNGGGPVAFTWDEDSRTLCSTMNETPVCATFEAAGSGVGFSTGYTTDAGGAGMATIIAETKD
jgi:hypothetical protein